MAAARKLQSEIDRTLKKINEGNEAFDLIWDKVYSAPSASQKEKFEADLKKEIKKLQRLRDQVKTWLQSNDVKDKTNLMKARKDVERNMERFKVCEKETKTKQFSKQGLAAAEEESPEEVARNEARSWINEKIEQMQLLIDACEADIESLDSGSKKKKKKNKDNEAIQELEEKKTRHQWHMEKLELCLRAIDNESVLPEQMTDIQEGVQYYLESHEEDDFYEDEELYDDLDLDGIDVDLDLGAEAVAAAAAEAEAAKRAQAEQERLEREAAAKAKALELKQKQALEQQQQAAKEKAKLEQQQRQKEMQQRRQEEQKQQLARQAEQRKQMELQKKELAAQRAAQQAEAQAAEAEARKAQAQARQKQQQQQQQQQQAGSAGGGAVPAGAAPSGGGPAASARSFSAAAGAAGAAEDDGQDSDGPQLTGFENATPAELIPLLDAALRHKPTTDDSDRPKTYTPRNSCKVPSCFPTTPLPVERNFVETKLDIDSLFFIFYHQQGTYQQYQAARQLKKQSWRYHKQHLKWFQRYQEPTKTTELYEKGTYKYFDGEQKWAEEIQDNFTFEYSFLEDEVQSS